MLFRFDGMGCFVLIDGVGVGIWMGGCWICWVSDEGEGEGGYWWWFVVVDVRGVIDGRGLDS